MPGADLGPPLSGLVVVPLVLALGAAGEELGARNEAPREGPLRIPSEIAITGEVAEALRTLGCEVFGTPLDRVAIGVPHLFAQHAEWKVAAWITIWPRWRRLTRVQRDWHGECRATGARVLTVRSARDAVEQFSALPSYLEGPPPMPFSFTLTTYAGPRASR